MNKLLIVVVLLVLFVQFGGPNVPKILKDNKQMVYGITIGLVMCSFFGVNVEGLTELSETSGSCVSNDFTWTDAQCQSYMEYNLNIKDKNNYSNESACQARSMCKWNPPK